MLIEGILAGGFVLIMLRAMTLLLGAVISVGFSIILIIWFVKIIKKMLGK